MMATVLDAFLVTLGLDNHEFKKGAEEVTEGITKLAEKAAGLFAVFAGGMELKEFIHSTMEVEISTLRLSKAIKMNIEDLQAWQGAAVMEGGSAEGVNESMKSLGSKLVMITENGPRAKRALDMLQKVGVEGLAIGKKNNILEVLDQLKSKVEGMDSIKATTMLRFAGLGDAGLIRVLRSTGEEFASLKKEAKDLGFYTKEDAEASLKLEEAQNRLKLSGAAVGRQIMTLLMPALQWVAESMLKISKWAKDHADIVQAAFIGIAVTATAAAIAVAAASWEFILIAAAIVAAVSGITYLITKYKEWDTAGNETSTKLGKFFAMLRAGWMEIKGVVYTAFREIWEIIKDYVDVVADEFSLLFALMSGDPEKVDKAFKVLAEDIAKLMKEVAYLAIYEFTVMALTIQQLMDGLSNYVETKWNNLTDKFGGLKYLLGLLNPAGMAIGASIDIKHGLSTMGGIIDGAGRPNNAAAVWGQKTAASNSYTQSQSSNSTQIHVDTIQVNTQATDAHGIAQGIFGSLVAQADGGLH